MVFMMNIAELLTPAEVLEEMKARDKEQALVELARPVLRKFGFIRPDELLAVLRERENIGTTAVGDGVAIPHGKIPGLNHAALVVGRSRAGIDFGAVDQRLCHIFFLVLTPEGGAGQHLRLLAQISRRAKDAVFRQGFMQAPGGAGLWQFLSASQ